MVETPTVTWAQTTPDRWVEAELRERLNPHDAWSMAVGTGLFARLARAGRGEHVTLAPRAWARSLDPNEAERLEARALSETGRLAETLAMLEDAEDPPAHDELRELCHGRDDVESIRFLLRQRGQSSRLDRLLATVDKQGACLMASQAMAIELDDERLRRVSVIDADAWWAQPAVWEMEAAVAAVALREKTPAPAAKPAIAGVFEEMARAGERVMSFVLRKLDRLGAPEVVPALAAAGERESGQLEETCVDNDVSVSVLIVDAELVVSVARKGQPVPNAGVTLALMSLTGAPEVKCRSGTTNANGTADLGSLLTLLPPSRNESYRVNVSLK